MNIFLLSFDSDIKLIFMWWLEQFSKLINVMKHIPIFGKTVTLYHVIIVLAVIKILIAIVKFHNNNPSVERIKANAKEGGFYHEESDGTIRVYNDWGEF